MAIDPLTQPCAHVATLEEQRRDPTYLWCNAQPAEPCTWANRHDGLVDPPFHSERLEYAANSEGSPATLSRQAFDDLVLGTGLV